MLFYNLGFCLFHFTGNVTAWHLFVLFWRTIPLHIWCGHKQMFTFLSVCICMCGSLWMTSCVYVCVSICIICMGLICLYFLSSSRTELAVLASRPVVGSSRNRTEGSMISSMPMLVLLRSPPEMPRISWVPTCTSHKITKHINTQIHRHTQTLILIHTQNVSHSLQQ